MCTLQNHIGFLIRFAVDNKPDAIKVLQIQLSPASPRFDFILRPENDSSICCPWQSPSMTRPYFHSVQNSVQQHFVEVNSENVYKIDEHDGTLFSFVGFARIIFDKITTSLKCAASTIFSVSAILPFYPVTYGVWRSEKKLLLIGLLPTKFKPDSQVTRSHTSRILPPTTGSQARTEIFPNQLRHPSSTLRKVR